MDEQQWNCLIGACCCEENCADKRRKVLADYIQKKLGPGPYSAKSIADLMLDTFDVMPRGTLEPAIKAVTKFVKAGDYVG